MALEKSTIVMISMQTELWRFKVVLADVAEK